MNYGKETSGLFNKGDKHIFFSYKELSFLIDFDILTDKFILKSIPAAEINRFVINLHKR